MRILFILIIGVTVISCQRSISARDVLERDQYDTLLYQLAPYVVKKPDEFSFEERFHKQNQVFYKKFIELCSADLRFYLKRDSATFFSFRYRDLTSLYEHYREIGGYLKKDDRNNITFVNLLYHTPRFTSAELALRGEILFKEMITNGNVNRYIGNRSFIHTPNADFYYNTKLSRWDYTENSSWKFMDEARNKADSTSR